MYDRIASDAYTTSNLSEVGDVRAVHYLLHCATFVSSHDFRALNLSRHLQDLNREDGYVAIKKTDDTYISLNVTRNYTLKALQQGKEHVYDYSKEYYVTEDIPEIVSENPNGVVLHLDHPFQDKTQRGGKCPLFQILLRQDYLICWTGKRKNPDCIQK